ncbi:MAG: hypothetical protein JSW05_02735 [Candidatus Thorarchaeota archaeon]|nr:MAG: hypothetical protein JSW05_02735 [Candidatus Thorarchaeota archaeon]
MRVLDREVEVRFWLKMALAIIAVMLMPFWSYANSTSFSGSDPTLYFSYTCILFNYQNADDWPEPDIWIRDTPTIVTALILCIPAIYFNRRLSKDRRNKSIWHIGSATVFSTASLAVYFVYSPPAPIAMPVPSFDWDILSFASVVLILLVLLPVFGREASQLGVQRNIASSARSKPRKAEYRASVKASLVYSILGHVLGLALCLLPFVLIINVWALDDYVYYTVSAAASLNHRYSQDSLGWTFSEITFNIPTLMSLVDQLVYTGFRTIFGFNIIRHCRGRVSRRRTLFYGIAGVLVPLVYFQFIQDLYSYARFSYLIPLPIVFIVGFLIIRLVKPLERGIEDDAEEVEEIATDQEKRRDPFGDVVVVPMLYALDSMMRGAVSRLKRIFSGGTSIKQDPDVVPVESEESEVRGSD